MSPGTLSAFHYLSVCTVIQYFNDLPIIIFWGVWVSDNLLLTHPINHICGKAQRVREFILPVISDHTCQCGPEPKSPWLDNTYSNIFFYYKTITILCFVVYFIIVVVVTIKLFLIHGM